MIVQHNIMALNSHRQLGVNNTNLQNNLQKLSSGYRINKAADDAAGLAISEKMRAQITGLNRAVSNARDASSLVQTAEGAMTEIHSMLNRMEELAVQSSNGVYDTIDRGQIQKELKALTSEIDRIADATNFNGLNLLNSGTFAGGVDFQVGDSAQSYDQIKVKIAKMNSTGIAINGLDFSGAKSALAGLAVVKKAINTVSTQRGELGAIQNRLDHTIKNLQATSENMTESESRIRDVDMAQEMMQFTKNNVLAQAAQSMLAQANQQPQQVLQLLR